MAEVNTDRNLLFGILAVQMDFIGRDALIEAMHAWVLDKNKLLGQVLREQGSLADDEHALLEAMLEKHLRKHGGDPEQSLAAVGVAGTVREDLRAILDPDLEATLARVASDGTATHGGEDSQDTATWGVGIPGAASRFRVLRPHAWGGIGVVSVALDQELHREVALKEILPKHADDPQSRARFLLEAEVTGRLEHPGVVPVYSLGQDDSGRPYYAMRLVRGDSLKEAIARFHADDGPGRDARARRLELRRLLRGVIDVCNTVAYAHSRGVIHRDIKPANILLGPYGETLVVDWGLAKVIGRDEATPGDAEVTLRPASTSGSSETVAGTAIGTPAYMSPEQAVGRLEELGPASDVYSLGATLYYLLTGKPPLEGDVGEVLRRAQRGEFPTPRQLNGSVPAALEAVCLKAMALKPEDRYISPRALAEEIEHWLADEPVSAYRDPPAVRLTRWGRRHRTVAVGIGALLVTAVAALVVSNVLIGYQKRQTEHQRQEAETQRAIAAKRADELDRQLYVDRVNRAYSEWEANNVALTERLLEECLPARRGWEWRFVRRLCHLDERTDRNAALVQALAISADGRTVAAGGGKWPGAPEAQGELVLRDAETGKERFVHRGLPTIIVGLAFSPGGDRLVSAGIRTGAEHKGELTLRDARTGRVLAMQPERDLAVLSVAFSRDGRYVAAGYGRHRDNMVGNGHVKIWDVSGVEMKRIATLPDQPDPIGGVAFSPDGKKIAAAGSEAVRIWTAEEGGWASGQSEVVTGHTGMTFAVAFRPDGKQLASAGWDRTVRLWDPDTGRQVQTLYGHTGFVRCLAYSVDGHRLASGSEDRGIVLWDTATGRPEATFRGHRAFVMALAFHPDGHRLASGGIDRLVKTWDLAGGQPLVFREHGGWVSALDFSPDGARVVSGGSFVGLDWSMRVRDAATGRRLQRYDGHQAPVVHVRFRPDGRHVVSGSVDATVRVWDATTGLDVVPPLDVRPPPPVANASAAIRPDGREIAVGATNGTIRLWDLSTGRVNRILSGHTGTVVGLAYDRDGLRLASTSASGPSRNDARPGGELKLWDVATGRELATPRRGIDVFRSLAFSPDGRRLVLAEGEATFAESGEAHVWDVETGREFFTLRGHTTDVIAVAYSPDGTRIATASIDFTVKLWDAATGQDVFTLRGHTAGVVSLAFSPDGRRLASGSIDWTARIWDARPPDDAPRAPSARSTPIRVQGP